MARPPKRHPNKPAPGYEHMFPTPKALGDGWTEWQNPVMSGYKIKCCECGLIHEVEFRVFVAIERPAKDENYGPMMPTDTFRVQLRMKRS